MKLIDCLYADTLRKAAADIMSQIKGEEEFLADPQYDHDVELKQRAREEIPMKVAIITPVLQNIYYAFYLFVDDEIRDFVEKYDITILSEEEYSKVRESEK
jgi:hypothetical protein